MVLQFARLLFMFAVEIHCVFWKFEVLVCFVCGPS